MRSAGIGGSGFQLPGLPGWTFQLALHGARLQLEAQDGVVSWSTWMGPTEDIREVAEGLIRQPRCCLG